MLGTGLSREPFGRKYKNEVSTNKGTVRRVAFELSLATTITVLKSVSCDHVTSFNYDGKKARDVGLTC